MIGIVLGGVGLLVIVAVSVLEARANQALWRKCRGNESMRQAQQEISLGRARIR
jgi:hypothetical protein